MSWLTPLFGGIVLASVIPPLVALYFLRLRRTRRSIPSTLLWKRSVEDLRANAPFQRLRPTLLLFLQLLFLALLGIALMQPRFDAGERRDGRTVIVVDNSSSMNILDGDDSGETSRLEFAKASAIERIEALHGGGLFSGDAAEIMVVAFNDEAEIRTPFTDSRQTAIQAVRGIEPTDGTSRLGGALQLARAYLTVIDPDSQTGPVATPAAVELWSDGRIDDLDEQVLREGERLEYHRVGSIEASNIGIASIAAQRPYDEPGRIQVFIAVENPTDQARTTDLQLSVNGVVRAITPVPIEIGPETEEPGLGRIPGRKQFAFAPFEQERDAVIEVLLLNEDAQPTDDAAMLVVPPARRLKVALVDTESFVLRSILEGMALESLDLLTLDAYETLAASGGLDDYDVVVLDDAAVETLPPGRYLSFGRTPPIEGLTEFGDPAEGIVVRRSAEDHPVLRYVNLDELFVSSMRKLTTGTGVESLVESGDGPMVVSVDRGPIQIIHATFDPLDSNWPYLRSFVNFVPNAIEYLGGLGDAVASAGVAPGSPLTARLPARAMDLRVRRPDGSDVAVESADPMTFAWGPVRRAGRYELSWTEPGDDSPRRRIFAVNQLDPTERRVAAAESIELSLDRITGEAAAAGGTRWQDFWPWLLGVSLVLMMLEWWLWQRQSAAG